MLVIRQAQLHALEESRFQAWMIEHVQQFFPECCAQPATLAPVIAAGLARARGYGFTEAADLCRFIDLGCTFGDHFDEDARLPWAAELLNAPDITDATRRMDLLSAAARAQLGTAA